MTFRIVQISDTHIAKDAPNRLQDLENCVRAINALEPSPELVIHTGDITHHGLSEEYQSAKLLLDELNMPYFVMAGNKDNRAELFKAFNDKRYRLPSTPWVQYAINDYPVRLLLVDTVSEQSNKGQLCTERLANIEFMLSENAQKPTALFLHHTPYEATGLPDPFQYENWSDVEKLARVMSCYDNIVGMYCGHVHRFVDGEIAGISASAITCLAGDLRKGAVSDEERKQPVFKVLDLSAT